jgi:hypothetical protein
MDEEKTIFTHAQDELQLLCSNLNNFLNISKLNNNIMLEIHAFMDSEINAMEEQENYPFPTYLIDKLIEFNKKIKENNKNKNHLLVRCDDVFEGLYATCRQIGRFNNDSVDDFIDKWRHSWYEKIRMHFKKGGRSRKTKRNPKYKKLKIK